MKKLEEIKVFCLEEDAEAANHREAIEEKGEYFPGVEIVGLNASFLKDLVLLDAQGTKITNFDPYQKCNFIRNPFRKNVFHIFDTAIYEQFERERFLHFKEVAHILGMKHYEFYRTNRQDENSSKKGSIEGFFPVSGEADKNIMKQEAFFTEEEYWPIQNNPNKKDFEEKYNEALAYAASHQLDESLDFKELFLCRNPQRNPIKTKVLKYSYLSCTASTLGFAISLENIFKIIPPNPYTKFLPQGFNLETTKETCESQSVNLKIDFFNLSNPQLPIWEDSPDNERYLNFTEAYLEEEKKKYIESTRTNKKRLHESELIAIPKAKKIISKEEQKEIDKERLLEENQKTLELVQNCMNVLQQHKLDDSLKVEDFTNLEQSLNNLRGKNFDKALVNKRKELFAQVFPVEENESYKANIELINKGFEELLT